jgi:hypothetical protein
MAVSCCKRTSVVPRGAKLTLVLVLPVQVMLENSHVIQADQLLAAVVRKGPSGAILNSSFKNRDNMSSGDDLGNLIVNVARVVPSNSGVLVFFPSYAVLQSMSERWKQQGSIWDRIDRNKKIFVEPRESANFKLVVDGFTAEVSFSFSVSLCAVPVAREVAVKACQEGR